MCFLLFLNRCAILFENLLSKGLQKYLQSYVKGGEIRPFSWACHDTENGLHSLCVLQRI